MAACKTLALFAIVFAACSRSPKVAEPHPPQLVVRQVGCQLPPAPEWSPVDAREGGKDSCPAEFAACVTEQGAHDLVTNVDRFERAWRIATALCKPADAPEANP